jgi:hypothetical protein
MNNTLKPGDEIQYGGKDYIYIKDAGYGCLVRSVDNGRQLFINSKDLEPEPNNETENKLNNVSTI